MEGNDRTNVIELAPRRLHGNSVRRGLGRLSLADLEQMESECEAAVLEREDMLSEARADLAIVRAALAGRSGDDGAAS